MRLVQVIAIDLLADRADQEVARTGIEHAKHYVEWLNSEHFAASVQRIKDDAAAKEVEPKFLDVSGCVFAFHEIEGEGS